MRNAFVENKAHVASLRIKAALEIAEAPKIGIVLGTGWGDVLALKDARSVPFRELPGFEDLGELEGHARQAVSGTLSGKNVVALRGRVHLNEAPCDPKVPLMVRLQIEMLLQLGVRRLILTCAVGALDRRKRGLGDIFRELGALRFLLTCGGRFDRGSRGLAVGDVCIVDDLLLAFAPDMPGFAGEFGSPADTLDPELRDLALRIAASPGIGITARPGAHAMVRGPFFESRRNDKVALARAGASVVGMSVLPEACIASLYPDTKVLALGFVTNGATEEHSHEENIRRAKASREKLGAYLERIVAEIP